MRKSARHSVHRPPIEWLARTQTISTSFRYGKISFVPRSQSLVLDHDYSASGLPSFYTTCVRDLTNEFLIGRVNSEVKHKNFEHFQEIQISYHSRRPDLTFTCDKFKTTATSTTDEWLSRNYLLYGIPHHKTLRIKCGICVFGENSVLKSRTTKYQVICYTYICYLR